MQFQSLQSLQLMRVERRRPGDIQPTSKQQLDGKPPRALPQPLSPAHLRILPAHEVREPQAASVGRDKVVENAPQVPHAHHSNHPAAAVDCFGALEGPRQVHVPLMEQRAHHLNNTEPHGRKDQEDILK